MNSGKLMILITTFGDQETAEKVARLMVDAGLAVCAQVGSGVQSFYRWDGEVCCESEVEVRFKVLNERFQLFCGELELQHPYDVPQVVAWQADHVSRRYLRWAESGDS